MQSYLLPWFVRTLLSSVAAIGFANAALSADTATSPPRATAAPAPKLLKASDAELPPEVDQPVAPSAASTRNNAPLGKPTDRDNRYPELNEAGATQPAAKADSPSSDPAPGAPQELPPAKDANQPSPLRLQVPATPIKPQTPPVQPKTLSFKPEADSSGLADRLKASAGSQDKSGPSASDNATGGAPSNDPYRDDALPENSEQTPNDTPEESATDGDASASPKKGDSKHSADAAAIEPAPDYEDSGPAPLEAASFNGVTPGQSTIDEVEKAWGTPKEVFKQNELMTQLYSIEPFDRIEVGYDDDKVSSIIVRFQKPFSADKIAAQLDMASIKPVLVLNDLGEILGQSYPERGVLFAFEPNADTTKPSSRVSHIMLEPIGAEPFVLRAETTLESRYDRTLQDLQIALDLQPQNARASWLMARVLAAMEQFEKAEAASAAAVDLEPKNVRYTITHAQILGQTGRLRDALAETQKAIDMSAEQPHLQARALCLKGDLTASGPKPDYRKAIGFHAQALKTADSVANDPHPAVRKAAKEALVDAHLGSAHDIAWGDWKDKEKAVTMWIKRAVTIADDLTKNEEGTAEQLFRVYTRALSAFVGVRPGVDPKPWLDEAIATGEQLIAETQDPVRRAQYQWDLGMAMYDAVQICQNRSNHALARQFGETAVAYLEQGYEHKQSPTTTYLLGRLYFRLGAIHAIRDEDHAGAVVWFEKAVPLLDKPIPPEALPDLGRYGETFVSMGVSYWKTGSRKKAIDLTLKGIKLMEQAVAKGTLERSALAIPYGNLAAMQRQIGAAEEAAKSDEMAAKLKDTKSR